jgi:hypothetical protein
MRAAAAVATQAVLPAVLLATATIAAALLFLAVVL